MGKHIKCSENSEVFFRDTDGTEYKTIIKLAKALKVTTWDLRERINHEESIDKAVQLIREEEEKKQNQIKKEKTRLCGPYTFQGKEYKNIKELAEVLGVSTDSTRELLRKMKSPDAAYEHIQENQERYFGYEYEGKRYSTYKELANAYSLSIRTFMYCLRKYDNDIETAMNKALELEKQRKVRQLYKKLVNNVDISRRVLKEIIMRSLETGEDLQELINQNQKKNKVFIYKGKIFKSKSSLAKELGIAIPTLNRYLEKFGDNIEEIAKKLNGYFYKGECFETVEQLSEYIGIEVNRLEYYLIKCEKNVEKAIFILKMNDARNQKIKVQLPGKEEIEIDTVDLSIILGMKQRELSLAIYIQTPIGELKEKDYSQLQGERISYSKKIELLKYCVQNSLDFKHCCVNVETYGRSFKEVTKMKKIRKLIPEEYVVKKYGALLRILDEREGIDHTEIISELRDLKLSIEELIEYYLLQEKCSEQELEFGIMKNIYGVLASEIIDDEEKNTILTQISPTKKECECVRFVQDKMKRIRRLIQLNDVVQILKSDCSEEEKNKCLKDNSVTSEEIEILLLDLYDEYDFRKNRNQSEEKMQNRKVKRSTTIRWTYMTEQERSKLSENFSKEELKEIISKSNILEHYKRIIQSFNKEEIKQSNEKIPSSN